ncbi:neurotrypsin-like [Antedon mediterranea]|uniref:neurotrypsin-like n=1 Tax=Antedon mediterranea TaxID=105859 RepID=UPI003AF881B3
MCLFDWSDQGVASWSDENSQVACRQLGFNSIGYQLYSDYESDSSLHYRVDFTCNGFEDSLKYCKQNLYTDRYCSYPVKLRCYEDEQKFGNYSIRLFGDSPDNSSNIGRIEIKYEGEWSQICIRDWAVENAQVACRQLGYSRGYQLYGDYESDSSLNYKVDFTCNGSEDSLKYCKQKLYIDSFCFRPVKLKCYEDEQQFENYTIRLFGDSSKYSSNIGWLEIKYEGEWSQICKTYWTGDNSQVACRQLGYSNGYQLQNNYWSDSSLNYRFDFTCNGFEDSLKYCKQKLYNDWHCFDPVKLRCYEADQQLQNYSIRLIGDSSEHSSNIGRLEITYEGEWSQICINDWTGENSHVACRQLGYSRGERLYESDSSLHYRVDFTCNGFEDSLKYCKQNLYTDRYCSYPVKLRCYEDEEQNYSIRLIGYSSDPLSNIGWLEIKYEGEWSQICINDWTGENSQVACRQLGYSRGERLYEDYKSDSFLNYKVDFTCNGFEDSLKYCKQNLYIDSFCFRPVKLRCYEELNDDDDVFSDEDCLDTCDGYNSGIVSIIISICTGICIFAVAIFFACVSNKRITSPAGRMSTPGGGGYGGGYGGGGGGGDGGGC